MFSKRKHNWGGLILLCAIIVCGAALGIYFFSKNQEVVKVNLKVSDATIFQDEEMPMVAVQASAEKENKLIQNFIADVHDGKGYQIQTEGDLSLEGEYTLSLVWNDDIVNGNRKSKLPLSQEL